MEITGVRVTKADGTSRDYPAGRGFRFDGYQDLLIVGERDTLVAHRSRADGGFAEVELLYGDAPADAASPAAPEPAPAAAPPAG